ncbi:hypothetical protein HJB91_30465 [Rhizobium sp. NLR10b]|nr:hypothetical protein [Rhizobium sp. NLR10b]
MAPEAEPETSRRSDIMAAVADALFEEEAGTVLLDARSPIQQGHLMAALAYATLTGLVLDLEPQRLAPLIMRLRGLDDETRESAAARYAARHLLEQTNGRIVTTDIDRIPREPQIILRALGFSSLTGNPMTTTAPIRRPAGRQTRDAVLHHTLDALLTATPRLLGQSYSAWANDLRAAAPGLSYEGAFRIARGHRRDIPRPTTFWELSAGDRASLEAFASTTRRLAGQSDRASGAALRAAEPGRSAADAAPVVRANNSDIAGRRALREAVASATPRLPGQSNRAWAAALREAEPGLSAVDAARIVRASEGPPVRRQVPDR